MSQSHPPIPEPQPHAAPQAPPDAGPTGTGSTAVEEFDDRTQSILLPPSQRQDGPGEQPYDTSSTEQEHAPYQPAAAPGTAPTPPGHPATGPIEAQSGPPQTSQPEFEAATPGTYQPAYESSYQPSYQPAYQASYDPGPGQMTAPVDFVPGFAAAPAPAAPPPAQGPATNPGVFAATPSAGAGSRPGDAGSSGSSATLRSAEGPFRPTDTAFHPDDTGSPAGDGGVRSAGRDRTLLIGLGLGVLALVLLELGLALDFGNQSLWEVVPTWSAFATVAAVVVLVPFVTRLAGRGLPPRTGWQIGAGGLAALAVAWVLVALPLVASDRGFWLTAALGAAAAALWLAPGRDE